MQSEKGLEDKEKKSQSPVKEQQIELEAATSIASNAKIEQLNKENAELKAMLKEMALNVEAMQKEKKDAIELAQQEALKAAQVAQVAQAA